MRKSGSNDQILGRDSNLLKLWMRRSHSTQS